MGAQWLSGRVLDSRPRGCGFEPHGRHCVVPLTKNINPSLVLVQPRKTRPFITQRLFIGRKESNQTKFIRQCFVSIRIKSVISELCFEWTILQRNYRKMTILWSFSYNSFVKFHGKKLDSHNMTMLYPNPFTMR